MIQIPNEVEAEEDPKLIRIPYYPEAEEDVDDEAAGSHNDVEDEEMD